MSKEYPRILPFSMYNAVMNYFSRYKEYLKDNPEGYWFKRKLYGWGWTPAKWQGWAVVAIFVAGLALMIIPLSRLSSPNKGDTTWFLIKVALWAIALIAVCYWKGEAPKWQWGQRKDVQN
jgi:hypothetical protein